MIPSRRARCGGPPATATSRVVGGFAPPVLPAAGAAASASWASRANSPAVCWRAAGSLASERSITSPSAGGRSARASSSEGGGSLTWANMVPTFESRRNGETRVST